MSTNKRTVTVQYPARVIVMLELRVSVPVDDDGEPLVEDWEITGAGETMTSSVGASDVTEAIANDEAEAEAFRQAILEALAEREDD